MGRLRIIKEAICHCESPDFIGGEAIFLLL
jgi:hypothetical protein